MFRSNSNNSHISILLPIVAILILPVYFYLGQVYRSFPERRNSDEPAHSTAKLQENFPDLILFRRTRKTGSTTMENELRRFTKDLGYYNLHIGPPEIRWIVRAISTQLHPRIFITHHNDVVRSDFPGKKVIIVDTVRNGYDQITSFCNQFRGVKTCDTAMETCFRSKWAIDQINYRWANGSIEDADTYIDLPVSSAHPSLSTAVLRRIFPNITIRASHKNIRNSTCPYIPSLREVYDQLYNSLDEQILLLKRRMLVVAGYPIRTEENGRISLINDMSVVDDMIDTADQLEKQHQSEPEHKGLQYGSRRWIRQENGTLALSLY